MRRGRGFLATRATVAAQPVSIPWCMAATGVCTADFIGSIQLGHPWSTTGIPRGQVKMPVGLRLLTRGIMLTRPYPILLVYVRRTLLGQSNWAIRGLLR